MRTGPRLRVRVSKQSLVSLAWSLHSRLSLDARGDPFMIRQLLGLAVTWASFSLSEGGSGLLAQDPGKTVYLQSDQLVVAQVKDSNAYLAYGKKAGKWNRFDFPQGVNAVPVLSGGVCAFELTGDAVRELVAVDLKGSWRTIKLAAAAQKCVPIVS